jgi:ribosomal protein S18 acetylase RimI-like enzyme
MEIVPASESHVRGITEVWKEFTDFHRDIDPFFTTREDAQAEFDKYLRTALESKDSRVFVVLGGGNIVGYAIAQIAKYPPVFKREIYGYITDFVVKASHRRRGIGTELLQKIYDWFKPSGIDRIELRVAAQNEVGYSFWRKHGFQDYIHVLYKPFEEERTKDEGQKRTVAE